MENVLGQETSPYLLQHKANPVHWQPWGKEALDEAKKTGKPILLSVGYAACHWCHVMAHESFEDPATAAIMNNLFINIKVDREERPDIDQIYQTALALLGEQGGWPLTMFLTSKGEPFWGGTYFPVDDSYGRPGFKHVLETVHGIFKNEPEKVSKNRDILRKSLKKMNETGEGDRPKLTLEVLDRIAERYSEEVDPEHGGIGSAPKFPHTYVLENMWRSYLRTSNESLAEAVIKALTHMSQGGIYDHLGGGYARYATDVAWLVPHFEKMLYDNAQILDLMLLVQAETKSELFKDRIYETIEWVFREMIAENGAFSATIDADSEGIEGKFYVWTEEKIRKVLGDKAEQFLEFYDVEPDGNWEGVSILNRLAYPTRLDEETEVFLKECRAVLFKEREKRIRPGLDDKVLTDWNGMMIATLAKAGDYYDEPEWLDRAESAFFAITSTAMEKDGRLYHSYRLGQAKHKGLLDDYANMCRAALTLYEITGRAIYMDQAQQWVGILNKHFWAKDDGYCLTADDAESLIIRTKNANDNATPAGNGVMIEVLARLHYLTGGRDYFENAKEMVQVFSVEIGRNFFPLSTFLNNFETLISAKQIIIVGDRAEEETTAFLSALKDYSLPNKVVNVLKNTEHLPFDHPANGKTAKDGKTTLYLCTGPTCSEPVTSLSEIHKLFGEK